MVKIGAGKLKGREIKTPDTRLTRVSTSYSRKVIFDTLSPYIYGAKILDLFAGSGSLGIEGISRGARTALFIDSETKPFRTIKGNLVKLEISDCCRVLKKDVLAFLKGSTDKYDLIFLDPPYTKPIELIIQILELIDSSSLLEHEGMICLELSTRYAGEITALTYKHFKIFKEKKKGDTTLLFFQKIL